MGVNLALSLSLLLLLLLLLLFSDEIMEASSFKRNGDPKRMGTQVSLFISNGSYGLLAGNLELYSTLFLTLFRDRILDQN